MKRSASLGEIYSHSLMTDIRRSTPVLPVGPLRKYQRGCGDEYQISDLKSLQEQLIAAKTKILTAEDDGLVALSDPTYLPAELRMRVYEEVAFVVDLFNDPVFEKLYWKAPEVLRSGVLYWGLRFLAHLAPGLAKPASLIKGLEVIDPATMRFAYDADQAHRRFSNLLGYVEANIYIKGAVGGYIKRIEQAVEGLNEIMERAYGLVSELEKLQGAAQGEVDSAVDGYLHSDETDEAAIAAEAEALRSAGWRETSAWVKTAAPEALEPGLDLGTNAGEVLGDVAARNMAAIVASQPDDA